MGACCAKKQDREAGIKYQIERTVVEQQKIRQEEEEEEQQIQIQCQSPSSRSKMMEMEVQNQAEIYNLVTQAGGDEVQEKQEPKKSEKTKKKRTETKAEDSNYLRKIDHKLGIKSLVVEMVIEGEMKYYKISILVEYKEFSFSLSLNGTLTTQQDFNYITISPQSYTQASKYSRFLTFFSNDNYFSADKDCVNQFNSFDKLLNVVRSLQELKMNNKRIQRRHTTVIKDSKNDDKLLVETKNHEMLEIITIVDIEYQSRFLNLLFHLLVQKYFKQLEQNLVFITNTTFLFEKPPQFDQPNVYKLALFYDNLDYSLNDLAKLLIEKNLELSQYLYQKLVVNLLNIFYNCYSNFFYRLNFTLNTIFFVSKYKCFKLQSFNRLKYLLQFGVKPDISLKNVEEKKYRLYSKAFKKDLFALCDLILYFKNVNGQQFKKLQSKRKRFFSAKQDQEDVEEENYLIYVENMFTNQKEQNILEFFRLAAYSKDIKQIEKTLADCLPIIESLQKILTEYELKLELKDVSYKPTQENHTQNMNQILQEIDVQSNLSFSDKDENIKLKTFQLDFNEENQNLSLNQDKLSEDKLLYKELIFQSILYQGNYSETYSKFKSCKNSSLQEKAHAEVLFAFHQAKQMNEDSWQFKLEMISQLMSRPVEIINSIFKAQLDSFFVTLLFQVLTLSNNKPLPLLNELSSCINVQLKEKLKKKKQQKIQSQTQTIIEQKKYIMLQLMFAQSYLSHFNYYQAIHKIQRVIGFQLKNSHVASLFYGYSLLVSGEIQKESLQAVSAMLNLEMGQVIYHSFFPEYVTQEVTKEKFDEQQQQQQQQQNTNTTEQANNNNTTPNQQFILTKIQNLATSNKSKLELLLGLSYFEIHDQENSLRCLKTAEQLLLRSFNMFADEVITVVLKQLEIYVLQDDIGSALKITRSYALKMAQYYKEGRLFKRKIIAKLQFVMGSVFEFNGQLISAIRFIERSNKTYNNSKCLNFVVQMHFQAKKLILIQKLKDAFIKIKSKQFVQNKIDLCVFQSLNESMSQVFLSQFYRQRVIQKSSLMMDKYGSKLIKVKSLIRIGKKQKAIKFIKKCLKKLSKNKKDEIYAIFSIHQTELQLTEQKQQAQAKIIISQIELIEMFLFFPQKDYHLINHYILLMLHYAKMNESKLIQDTYSKIQQAIDDFFEILQWKSISTKQYSNNINNKFEILMKKSKITLLYLIYAIIDLIDYFNSIKKEIFNSIFKGKNMTEESEKIRTQYQEYFRKLNQNLNERKESCLFGYCKISHKNNQNLVQNQKNQKNDQELEAQNTIKTRQSKLEIQSQNKIILDVRSVDEILISNRRKTKVQQISSIEISQPNQTLDTDVPQSANRQVTKTSSHSRHKQTSSEKNIKKPVKLNPFESTTKKSVKK